jgi:hypothetical protein
MTTMDGDFSGSGLRFPRALVQGALEEILGIVAWALSRNPPGNLESQDVSGVFNIDCNVNLLTCGQRAIAPRICWSHDHFLQSVVSMNFLCKQSRSHTLDMRVDFRLFLMAEDEVRLLAIKVNIPDLKKCKLGK